MSRRFCKPPHGHEASRLFTVAARLVSRDKQKAAPSSFQVRMRHQTETIVRTRVRP